jgi:hypothetical protein
MLTHLFHSSPEKQQIGDFVWCVHVKRCILGIILWLWRSKSSTICCLQTRESEEPVVWLPVGGWWPEKLGWELLNGSESKAWGPGVLMLEDSGRWMLQLEERIQPSLGFCSMQVLSVLDDAWLVREGTLALLIQMLFSSNDTLTCTPRNNVLPVIWASLHPVKWTLKMNHLNLYVNWFHMHVKGEMVVSIKLGWVLWKATKAR